MVKAQERFLLMSCEALNSERAGAANERVQRTSGCSERAGAANERVKIVYFFCWFAKRFLVKLNLHVFLENFLNRSDSTRHITILLFVSGILF